ncbi:hypothetical protein AB0I49_25405 [Streptomyces sp. NPDC050617]
MATDRSDAHSRIRALHHDTDYYAAKGRHPLPCPGTPVYAPGHRLAGVP